MKGAKTLLGIMAFLVLAGCSAESADVDREPDSAAESGVQAPKPPSVHPRFEMDGTQFETLIGFAPVATREGIRRAPTRFLDLLSSILDGPEELTWVIDRDNPVSGDYEPSDLVDLDLHRGTVDLSRSRHRLRRVALDPLGEMVSAARQEGITLLVSSVYRSYAYQADVYQYWVETLGEEEADRTSARPGTSQHQLGTTIDFGCICEAFAQTAAGIWLEEHAWRFGFSLSYPEGLEELTGYQYESWHYRYIGRDAARMEREFFNGIQHDLLHFIARARPSLDRYHR